MAKKAAPKKKAARKSTGGKTKKSAKRSTASKKRKAAKKTTKSAKKSRTTKSAGKSTAKRKSTAKAKRNSSPAKARQSTSSRTTARKTTSSRTTTKAAKAASTTSTRKAAASQSRGRATAIGHASGRNNKRNATSTYRSPATAQDPIQFPEESKRIPKTPLKKRELNEFRKLLLERRAELAGDVQNLTRDAFSSSGSGFGEHSSMPIHMADRGSDNWEQEFTLGLIENEQSLIREIDEALVRIENRTYGICLATHQPISLARLRAKPWAKYCIEYARAREEGRA